MNDHDRLYAYVERFFERSGRTEWPQVRRVARSLGWTQERVEDAAAGDPDGRIFLSSYNVMPEPTLGEHFVETI